MIIPTRAAVILEVPEPTASRVRSIQARHGYGQSAELPIHVTLVGSNGIGDMILEGDPGATFARIDAIAAATAPIVASFGAVIRFPRTDTFALTLADDGRVTALHEAIARSELRFDPSPYPFQPHCTITSDRPVSSADAAQLLALRVAGSITLRVVHVFRVHPPAALLHSTLLREPGAP